MNRNIWKKVSVFTIFGLLIGTVILPNISSSGSFFTNHDYVDIDEGKKLTKEENDIDKVTICLKKYDSKEGIIEVPIGAITIEKALMLKSEFREIWQKNIPVTDKISKSVFLLDEVANIQLPLKNIIKPSDTQNEDTVSITNRILNDRSENDVFNFISLWGAFCLGQPNVYSIGGNRTINKLIIQENPQSNGWNMSFFGEYGISVIMLPFLALGFFGTAGMFGVNTLQNPMFAFPTTFFAFIVGTLFLGLSFKIGDPYLSVFELYIGIAGFPVAFPV